MIELLDQDGDGIRVQEVFGFGEPMVVVRVWQEGESSMNLTVPQVVELIGALQRFVDRAAVK